MTLQKLLILSVLFTTPIAARVRLSSFCQQGGVNVMTNSLPSANKFQQSYPGATVAVYITGGASGYVTTSGTAVTWIAGTLFNANSGWVGLAITINSVTYTIASVSSINTLTLSSSAGAQTGVAYSMPATAPAAIYSDNAGTAKANPYTCDNITAQQFIYADNGTYDFRFSGTGIVSPFTIPAVSGIDPLSTTTGLVTYNGSIGTAAQQCAAAAAANQTLIVSQVMGGLPTQTMLCSMQFIQGGIIQPASGQTVTLNPNFSAGAYQKIFDVSASGSAIAFSGTAPAINPNWLGANWTCSGDGISAFNAAIAISGQIHVVPGCYNLSAPTVLARTDSSFICDTGALLLSTAAGSVGTVDSVVTLGPAERLRFEGCQVQGPSSGSVARAVHATFCNQCVIRNVDFKGAGTLLAIDNSVTVLVDNPSMTQATGIWGYEPSYGIDLTDDNLVRIINPRVEYIATSRRASGYPGGVGVGIRVGNGAAATTVGGGTSESNRIGVQVLVGGYSTNVLNMDNEDNCDADVEDLSLGNVIIGGLLAGGNYSAACAAGSGLGTSIHYGSTANQGSSFDVVSSNINVDAGAKDLTLIGNNMGNSACTGATTWCGTQAGTNTTSINNKNCCGSAIRFPILLPQTFLQGSVGTLSSILGSLTTDKSVNNGGETSGSANNALVVSLTRQDGSNVPVISGLDMRLILMHNLGIGANVMTVNGVGPYPILTPYGGGFTQLYPAGNPISLYLVGSYWFAFGAQ